MSRNQKNRRRTVIVNPQQQKRLVMTMSMIPSLALAATMGLICYFCHSLATEATRLEVKLDSLIPLFLAVSGFVLVAGFFTLSNALMVSHKIAGPAFRLRKSIEKIRGGDLAFKVSLRKGDYLEGLRDELNELLDVLNETPPEGFRTRAMAMAEEGEDDDSAPPIPDTGPQGAKSESTGKQSVDDAPAPQTGEATEMNKVEDALFN